MQVRHQIQIIRCSKPTLLCCPEVGVIGGVSVILGDIRPSVALVEHGSLCSWTLANL